MQYLYLSQNKRENYWFNTTFFGELVGKKPEITCAQAHLTKTKENSAKTKFFVHCSFILQASKIYYCNYDIIYLEIYTPFVAPGFDWNYNLAICGWQNFWQIFPNFYFYKRTKQLFCPAWGRFKHLSFSLLGSTTLLLMLLKLLDALDVTDFNWCFACTA